VIFCDGDEHGAAGRWSALECAVVDQAPREQLVLRGASPARNPNKAHR